MGQITQKIQKTVIKNNIEKVSISCPKCESKECVQIIDTENPDKLYIQTDCPECHYWKAELPQI